jgi:putative chitinase
MNRAAFFDAIRSALFGGRLNQAQVEGCSAILDAWARHGSGEPKHLAYVLATAYHETGRTMEPVRETFASSDAEAIRKLDAAWAAGKLGQVSTPYWRDGFFGRGFVQLTWRRNYEAMGKRLGIDLARNPSLALRPDIAARILIVGMIEGMFTGKSLSDYIGRPRVDYRNARRIVNGIDRAVLIADYADRFQAALEVADIPGPPDVPRIPDPDIDMRPLPDGKGGANIGAIIGALIAAAITAAAIFLGVK